MARRNVPLAVGHPSLGLALSVCSLAAGAWASKTLNAVLLRGNAREARRTLACDANETIASGLSQVPEASPALLVPG